MLVIMLGETNKLKKRKGAKMKRAIFVFILLFFVATQVHAMTLESTEQAINNSGKTRTLSMRMANLYGIQVIKDYPTEKKRLAKKQLDEAKKVMNDIYKALLSYGPVTHKPELARTVKEAQDNWHHMEKMLSKPPTQPAFLDVLDLSDRLLEANEMMTSYMESLSPVPTSEIINIAGRQGMYSQQLARDYLAASLGIDKEYRIDLMLDVAVEFESAMLTMEGSTENTAKIKGLIKSITKMEWRKVYGSVTECIESNGTKFNVGLLVKFCDTLLEKTTRLTGLYIEVS